MALHPQSHQSAKPQPKRCQMMTRTSKRCKRKVTCDNPSELSNPIAVCHQHRLKTATRPTPSWQHLPLEIRHMVLQKVLEDIAACMLEVEPDVNSGLPYKNRQRDQWNRMFTSIDSWTQTLSRAETMMGRQLQHLRQTFDVGELLLAMGTVIKVLDRMWWGNVVVTTESVYKNPREYPSTLEITSYTYKRFWHDVYPQYGVNLQWARIWMKTDSVRRCLDMFLKFETAWQKVAV